MLNKLLERLRGLLRQDSPWHLLSWLLISSVCLWRLSWLLVLPGPVGQDGYYYYLQVAGLGRGHLPIPTTNLLPLLAMRLMAWATGDIVIGIKLTAILGSCVLSLMVSRLVMALSKSAIAQFVAVALLLVATSHTFLLTEFLANLIGLAVGIAGATALLRKARPVAVLGWFAASLLSHPVGALVMVTLWFAVVVTEGPWTRIAGVMFLALLIVVFAGTTRGFWAGARIIQWPPHFPSLTSMAFPYVPMAAVFSIITGARLVMCFRRSGSRTIPDAATFGLSMLLLLAVANPFLYYSSGIDTVGDRLSMLGGVLASVLAASVGTSLWAGSRRARAGAMALVSATYLAGWSNGLPVGSDFAFLTEREAFVRALRERSGPLTLRTVVAEHGLQFAVSAGTGLSASADSRPERENGELWLVRRGSLITRSELPATALPLGPYFLIEPELVEQWLAALRPSQKDQLLRLNRYGLSRFLTRAAR